MARDVTSAGALAARAQRPPLEPKLREYDKSVRKRLRRLAKTSPRLGDLIFTFPAAAYSLAIGRGPVADRQRATALVKAGAPLAAIGDALALPSWVRKLPPAAFDRPFGTLIDHPEAARRLGGVSFDAPLAYATWFSWVNGAHVAAGPEVAFWIAKQRRFFRANYDAPAAPFASEPSWDALGLLVAYVAASQAPRTPIGKRTGGRWSPSSSMRGFGLSVRRWLTRVATELCADSPVDGASWRKTHSVAGFKFSPRLTPAALVREGSLMNNCVGTYAGAVREGECLIYAVRRGGVTVATLEIRAGRRAGEAVVAQLEAPSNQPAPQEVRRAAEAWLRRQGPCPLRRPGALAPGPIDPARWAEAVAPLFEGRGADALDPRANPAAILAKAPTTADEGRLETALFNLEQLVIAWA